MEENGASAAAGVAGGVESSVDYWRGRAGAETTRADRAEARVVTLEKRARYAQLAVLAVLADPTG